MAKLLLNSNFAVANNKNNDTMRLHRSWLFCVVMLVVALASPMIASAQHHYKFQDSLGYYEVKFTPRNADTEFELSPTKPLLPRTHELRLGMTWGATDYFYTPVFDMNVYGSHDIPFYQGPTHWYSIIADFGFWAIEWFSIGGTFAWVGGMSTSYNSATHERIAIEHKDIFNLMPTVRFAWLRHGRLQFYSSASLGFGIERNRSYVDTIYYDCYCAFDFKPIGVAIGRKWFGYAEVGYGARGIVNVGFGYRFNSSQH